MMPSHAGGRGSGRADTGSEGRCSAAHPEVRPPRVTRIVSGGQTGADRGGLDAAIALGVPHGGWCPAGRLAEDGRIPNRYPLVEIPDGGYAERTGRNVADSDGTVLFTYGAPRGGSLLTLQLAQDIGRPLLHIDLAADDDVQAAAGQLRDWVRSHGIATLNVAGSRASEAPGIGERVRAVVERALGGE